MTEEAQRKERAILKGKFSISVRKFKGSISRGGEIEELKSLASQVEKAYDALLESHFLLEDGDETYLETIDSEYQTIMITLSNQKKAFSEIEKKKKITAIQKLVTGSVDKVKTNLQAIDEILNKKDNDAGCFA